jgi:xanthine dehydrogenase YagT iron-sulfur-binding subunit
MTMPTSRARVDVGMPAPDFVLSEAGGRRVALSDLRGQPVILAFYPPEWDPSRADQLAHFNWLVRQVPGVNAELLGISMDGMWCELAFADDAVRVPLLADLDPHGAVAERFDVQGEQALIVVDAEGTIAWRHSGPAGTAPSASELLAALEALARPTAEASRVVLSEARDLFVDPGAGPSPSAQDDNFFALPPCARSRNDAASTSLPMPTRREFVATALAAALALAAAPLVAKAEPMAARLVEPAHPDVAATSVTLRINGRPVGMTIEPRVTLLDALREYAGLTGTKKGCDHGQCGACTVHVNGRRQLSCLTLAIMHQGDEITTVEGLASGDALHPLQTAFITHDGFQCGYCTSGQLMSAAALLKEPCGPSDADVKECMSGNICRCGAYPGIVAAIQDVRAAARG